MTNLFGNKIPGPRGKSAYQVAVGKGYIGTEVEWLLSLKGSDSTVPGPTGSIGSTGPQGPQGIQGEKGERGWQGEIGAGGQIGAKGNKGDSGTDGDIGSIGPQGIQGIQGPQGSAGSPGVVDTIGLTNSFASLIHTHSDLYQPTGAYLTTAANSVHTHSDLYDPLGNSTAYQTGTLSSALMPLGYSSGFQIATLSTILMPLANSSAFQTATLSTVLMPLAYSSAYQTATLAGTFMDKSYSSDFQTATLSNSFIQTSISSAWQTATLSNTFMHTSYSSAWNSSVLSTKFLTTAALSNHIHAGDGIVGFYEPFVQTNTSAWVPGVGSWYFAPFCMPGAGGGGRINFLANNTSTAGIMKDVTAGYYSSQTGGKNQSYTYQLSAALYSQGVGTNSTRLESFWGNTFSYGISHKVSISQSAANSFVTATVSVSIDYIQDIDSVGGITTAQFASNNNINSAGTSMGSDTLGSVGVSIRNMLSNQQMPVVPFNTTISEGNYWLGMMYSSTHATATSGTSYPGASALIMSQLNIVGIARAALAGYRVFGKTTSNVSDTPFYGGGVVYTVASASAPQYLLTTDLKSIANGIVPYFNFQRRGLTN